MRPLFIVGQMRPDSLCHRHDERPIIHAQPVAATDKLSVAVPGEWAVRFGAKVGLLKVGHITQL
jgi:hypothetical protein